ncbi:MAG: efflux RND transporter periplasmic adaptor subunit, partial [Chloroflexota bacterium]|nr:efflux RND transporter periplasmic adaptor subunit [Chloroflexota bacterium]
EQQTYADALRNAELQLSQAQSRLEQSKVAADNARQQEATDIASAQSQVDDAQVQLDELLKGPKPADVATAQAQLDQARA